MLTAVEQTKIQLTSKDEIGVNLNFVSDKPKIIASRVRFEEAIFHNLAQISTSIKECISQAQINPTDIQLVILTGGSTEIPLVQQQMLQSFPNAELSQENKLSSVGLGLAFDCYRRFETINTTKILNPANRMANFKDGR